MTRSTTRRKKKPSLRGRLPLVVLLCFGGGAALAWFSRQEDRNPLKWPFFETHKPTAPALNPQRVAQMEREQLEHKVQQLARKVVEQEKRIGDLTIENEILRAQLDGTTPP